MIEATCDFKRPTAFSDKVTICAAVKEFSGVRLRFEYEMADRDGVTVCVGTSVHAFLNAGGRPIRV